MIAQELDRIKMTTYQYSFQKIDMTPEVPEETCLGAYRGLRNNHCEGIKDRIYLFIYRYKISEREYCIITLDLLWIDEGFYQQIKTIVEEKSKIQSNNILVCCTHTHSAPYVCDDFKHFGQKNDDYNSYILQLITDHMGDCSYEKAVSIEEGYFDAPKLIANRNYIVKNPRKKHWTVILSPNHQLAYENKIRYIKITSAESQKPTYLINFSSHPTFNKSNFISSDYPGKVREIFEDQSCNAIFIQGYAGDQKVNMKKYTGKSSIKGLLCLKLLPSFNENIKRFTQSVKNIVSNDSIVSQQVQSGEADGIQMEFQISTGKNVRLQKLPLTENINLYAINAEPSFQLAEYIDKVHGWPVGYANGMIGYIPNTELVKIKAGYEYNSWSSFESNSPVTQGDITKIIDNIRSLAID